MPQSHGSIPDEHLPQQSERSHKRWRWSLAVLGLVLVFPIVGFVVLARHWPFSRETVIADLQDDFHGRVSFSRFHATVFPHPGCVAEDAKLVRPGSPAGSPPFASARKLIVRAHYVDFLFRRGYIAHIEVQGLEIHIPPRGSTPAVAWGTSSSTTRVGEV